MKINYVSLCSGYGAECVAFKRLQRTFPDFDFELLAWSEYDPDNPKPVDFQPAVMAHNALHPGSAHLNLGNLITADWGGWFESAGRPRIDFMLASTPCQSVSNAGKNEGMKKGTDAASALIWATEKVIDTLKPTIVMFENVKGMVSKRNRPDFDAWCEVLHNLGYVTQWQILNAKDYGEAQNRERVFLIAIRAEDERAGKYNYPKPFPLTLCVEDYMVPIEEVPEDAFIDDKLITEKVLSDMLDQKNVMEELTDLYHEEWQSKLF